VHVLVVDDEPEVLNLLVPHLRRQGYTVSEAEDGDEALHHILTERPNVVLLDVMMPLLDGWEVSRYVRERPELDDVRIVMSSGIGERLNAATAPIYGADAHIDKPFSLDLVDRTIAALVERIEAGEFGRVD
jgi:DNA-binding response OmpR family regulator